MKEDLWVYNTFSEKSWWLLFVLFPSLLFTIMVIFKQDDIEKLLIKQLAQSLKKSSVNNEIIKKSTNADEENKPKLKKNDDKLMHHIAYTQPIKKEKNLSIDNKDICPIPHKKIIKKDRNININTCENNLNFITNNKIFFHKNKVNIDSSSRALLDDVAVLINKCKEVVVNNKIIINTYTDSTGNEDYNQSLSERRAVAVKNYLIKKGVKGKLMKTIGHGEANPIASNATKEGRIKNRRIIFKIKT